MTTQYNELVNFGEKDLREDDLIKKVFDKFGKASTQKIKEAEKILNEVVTLTSGLVNVDIQSIGFFDELQKIEVDKNILSLYWKYDLKEDLDIWIVPNRRTDIVFNKLEFIIINGNISIMIKGEYQEPKKIKNHYCNSRGILNAWATPSHNMINLMKKTSDENQLVNVIFLPWKYFNILITSKSSGIGQNQGHQAIIFKNLVEIKLRIDKLENRISLFNDLDEDDIKMFGNRSRSILENLLKYIFIVKGIDFKQNYKSDMLGSIIDCLMKQRGYQKISNIIRNIFLDKLGKVSPTEFDKIDLIKKTKEELNKEKKGYLSGVKEELREIIKILEGSSFENIINQLNLKIDNYEYFYLNNCLLNKIILILNGGLVNNLNKCSHDNVEEDVTKEVINIIIEDIKLLFVDVWRLLK